MYRPNRVRFMVFIALVTLVLCGCAPVSKTSHPTTLSVSATSTWVRYIWPTRTALPPTFDPNDTPPELLFTPTPDPNAFSIAAKIEQEYSQEEIARILFSKWLDHYLSENISLEMRLSEYEINSVTIPDDQDCAPKLGALFIANAEVTAKTVMPALAPAGQYSSNWMASIGSASENGTHRVLLFKSAISKLKNEYILEVIMQAPMCD